MKRYPKYKDSGIEWLGEVPEGGEVKRLKWVVQCLDSKRIPLNSEERGLMQGEYPYYGANGVLDYVDKYLFDSEIVLLGEDGAPFNDPLKDVAFYVNHRCWVNNHAHVLRPLSSTNAKYLTYILNCIDYSTVITGSTRDKLNQSEMENIFLSFPPLNEQLQIATFLDQKTAKIDELIKKSERLIELLKEKRQASISHAVTKGLAPNAKMKDSGIEWIGEIPEGWEVKRLKHLAGNDISAVQTGPFGAQLHASDYIDEGVPLILIRNVNNLWIDDSNIPKISEEKATSLSMYRLQEGDIIFSRVGSIGRIALVTKREEGWLISGQMLRIRISNPKLNNHFLLYVADSNLVSEFIEFKSVGSTRDSINTDILRNVCIPLPSLLEQKAIIQYIETTTANIDSLIQKILSQIAVLKEYRQALISNVVTGKVRVYDCNLQGKRIK